MGVKMDKCKILLAWALSMGVMGVVGGENGTCCEINCRQNAVNRAQNYGDFLSAAAKCKGPSNNASFNTHDQSSPSSDYGNTSAFSSR
jgi:hypothetical protein